MEPETTLDSCSNIAKEELSKTDHNTRYQIVLQGHCNQNSLVLASNRYIDQWNRTESQEIDPCLYDQLISDKGGRSIKWSKNSFFNKWCWENQTGTCKKVELDLTYTIYKNKLKMDKRLKYKLQHHKSPTGEHREENLRYSMHQYFQ